MRRHKGGLYIGPWTLKIAAAALGGGFLALFVAQLPDLRRYIKFESM